MKNSSISSTEIEIEIRRRLCSLSSVVARGESRPQKSSPYNTQNDNDRLAVGVCFKSSKFYFLLRYLILFHFYPVDEKHYVYMRLDLSDHLMRNPDSFWLSVFLEDRNFLLQWLYEQDVMGYNDFFGNVCKDSELIKAMNSIILSFERQFHSPRRVIRRRGYKDKGSLSSESLRAIRKEESKDFTITLLQNRIEEERELRSLECLLLREHFTEGRVLSNEYLIRFKFKKGERQNEKSEGYLDKEVIEK